MSSHMSVHEEIREQQQKTKDMSAKGKLEYFWYYYKVHAIVAVSVIALAIMFIYQYATNKDYGFYAAFINANDSANQETWGDEFAEYAGIDTDKYLSYIDTSILYSESNTSQYTIAAAEKLIAMLQTGIVDILVADTETFEGYAQNEFFADLTQVLPEDLLEKYQDCLYYTDASTFNTADDDTFQTLDEQIDYDTFVTNHRDPSTMKQPIPVGICLPEGNRITAAGFYDYLQEDNTVYQGYPSEAVLGIPITTSKPDIAILFLRFTEADAE